jgi:hypothetical protein
MGAAQLPGFFSIGYRYPFVSEPFPGFGAAQVEKSRLRVKLHSGLVILYRPLILT